ncbi:MAG: fused MFS/spermidine synthase [Undibacterium sp.]|nr:fused MFS/spermidine synthase [Opitutaceae bacterium]
MKSFRCLCFLGWFATAAAQAAPSDYVEDYDTLYNNLTVEKTGSVVELRARSRAGEYLESAVDLADPLRLVVPYTRTLFAAGFLQAEPKNVLMIGLGGAGFHRVFVHAFPDARLQSVELDPKVFELCRTRLDFKPTAKTPVAVMDGRLFVKRNREQWDWLILDAFRGGFVPPHLKTQEFYRECAARVSERGVFVTNLHQDTALYAADLKTIQSVFPQVVLFETKGRGNIVVCAVKYRSPDMGVAANWAALEKGNSKLAARIDLSALADERIAIPTEAVAKAQVLTDDFSPVEFLDASKANNTKKR